MAKRTYTVKKSDDPITLGKKLGVSPQALLEKNGIVALTPGQTLSVPAGLKPGNYLGGGSTSSLFQKTSSLINALKTESFGQAVQGVFNPTTSFSPPSRSGSQTPLGLPFGKAQPSLRPPLTPGDYVQGGVNQNGGIAGYALGGANIASGFSKVFPESMGAQAGSGNASIPTGTKGDPTRPYQQYRTPAGPPRPPQAQQPPEVVAQIKRTITNQLYQQAGSGTPPQTIQKDIFGNLPYEDKLVFSQIYEWDQKIGQYVLKKGWDKIKTGLPDTGSSTTQPTRRPDETAQDYYKRTGIITGGRGRWWIRSNGIGGEEQLGGEFGNVADSGSGTTYSSRVLVWRT